MSLTTRVGVSLIINSRTLLLPTAVKGKMLVLLQPNRKYEGSITDNN
jgi:hypothetical protein